MVETSFQHISPDGFVQGWYGWRNFGYLWAEPDLPGILLRTLVWVVAIVGFTMLISLATAQLFNEKFPGFETDVHGLVKGEVNGKRGYFVDCVKQ